MFDHNLLTRIVGKVVIICLFCLLAPLIHIVYAYTVWEDSVGQFYQVLNAELHALILVSDARAEEVLTATVDNVYSMVHSVSVIENDNAGDGSFIRTVLVSHWEFIQLLVISIQLITLRTSVLILSAPLFLAGIIVGASNGILIWCIRRSAGSMDSAYIYHRAKTATYYGVIVFFIAYICPPIVIIPHWIIPLYVFFTGGMMSLTIGFFKKYL